jgi:hypothetical protein
LRDVTAEEARHWWRYDPETGDFWYRSNGKLASCVNDSGYIRLNFKGGRTIAAHRAAWIICYGSIPPRTCVVHKDFVTVNNAISNLKLASINEVRARRRPPFRWTDRKPKRRGWYVVVRCWEDEGDPVEGVAYWDSSWRSRKEQPWIDDAVISWLDYCCANENMALNLLKIAK